MALASNIAKGAQRATNIGALGAFSSAIPDEEPQFVRGLSKVKAMRAAPQAEPQQPAAQGQGMLGAIGDTIGDAVAHAGRNAQRVATAPGAALNPDTGLPWTPAEIAKRDNAIAKRQKEVDAQDAAGKKIADKDKPLWSKWHEARARYEMTHGVPTPEGWISTAEKNVGGDPALMPQWVKDQGTFRTDFGDTANKTPSGLTNDDVWAKLFQPSKEDKTPWKNFPGGGQVSPDGRFRAKADNGKWVEEPPPAAVGLDRHFQGKWADATPEERANLIRADVGIPASHQGWVLPSDTAKEVGADAVGAAPFTDPASGSTVPAGSRTVAGQYGSGFATTGPRMPSMPPPQPAVATMPTMPVPLPPPDPDLPAQVPGL